MFHARSTPPPAAGTEYVILGASFSVTQTQREKCRTFFQINK